MLKILQARLQQYMNWELPDVQAGFRKGRATRDQIDSIQWIIEKAREFQKNDCVDHNKLWKILKEMGRPDHLTLPGTTDWFQIGKGVCQGLYCHPAYLSYMQSAS